MKTVAVIISIILPLGCIGIWACPAMGSESYLYTSPKNDRTHNQAVVDKADSALWWRYGKGYAVIDHSMSEAGDGLWDVSQIRIGDIATLTIEDKETMYVCVGTALCRIRNNDYAFKGKAYAPMAKGDVVCLSCAEEDGYVYAAYFEPMV